jgi:hypothetical protein
VGGQVETVGPYRQDRITKQKQAYLHDPDNGVYGDCFRTAIACILNIDKEKVPHLAEKYWNEVDGDKWTQEIREFLNKYGYTLVDIPFGVEHLQDILTAQAVRAPDALYLLQGSSARGCGHVVVCLGGEIICDTALTDSTGPALIGPSEDGYFWVSYIVPLRIEVKV